MILDQLDTSTGLPIVQESRVTGSELRALPKWLGLLAAEALPAEARWVPNYLKWDGPTLTAVTCWKCGVNLCGWKPVLDKYGNIQYRNDQMCVWLRMHDHYRETPVHVRWACLGAVVEFTALHCADCRLEAADIPMLSAIVLAGHDRLLAHGRDHGIQALQSPSQWATHLYRWSDASHIQCEPIGIGDAVAKKPADVLFPTPGKPMTPNDYLQWGEAIRAQRFYPGMVMEFEGAAIPPGWAKGKKKGTIVKR